MKELETDMTNRNNNTTRLTALYPGQHGWTRKSFAHSVPIFVGIIQYL